ncbi:hypothetical protein BMS3Abin06_02177 [bacterium BMS3Abin06]|nr:hypothetical protein BMS3Abin06_02177 [bacterium BMS3Abin06]
MKRLKNLTILISAIFFLYGCGLELALVGVGAGVGIASYKYIDGQLVREYPLAYDRAWDAANKALENLQISTSSSMNEGGKGTIEAVSKDGKKVQLSLKDKGLGVTSITVRVGIFGDRLEAQKIHEEIASVSGL